jgi:hypothetical protein
MSDGIKIRDVNQHRAPNFRDEKGQLYLVRCYVCGGTNGKENYALNVALGACAWCGWNEENNNGSV